MRKRSRTELVNTITQEQLRELGIAELSMLCNFIGVSRDSWDTAQEAREKIWSMVTKERTT